VGSDATGEPRVLVARTLAAAAEAHARLAAADPSAIVQAAALLTRAVLGEGRVLVFGNGGSAAEAQHFAAELVGRFVAERQPLAAMALTTDTSILTAVGNDYAFDAVFARQVEALGRRGDVAVGLSTSGRSPNVIAALRAARARGLGTVALTGRDGGEMGSLADVHVNVPEQSTARIQEAHLTILHIFCELIDRAIAA
jgi:D-sedoheptulose 7-phosphate isomerase